MGRVVSIHEAAVQCGRSREPVLCNGCFDMLHVGHIRHLQAARKLGNLLVVSVTQDAHVNKGPGRPVFSQEERAEMLAALACVDLVFINTPTPGEAIELLRPAVYCKGSEYRNAITPELAIEQATIEAVGGNLVFTETTPFHTTELLEKLCKLT